MATQTGISKAPRCTNHTPMSAVWKCDACNAYLCRLCTELTRGVDCCTACKAPCRRLTPEELGTAARAQTTVLRTPGLSPLTPQPPGELAAPPRSLRDQKTSPLTPLTPLTPIPEASTGGTAAPARTTRDPVTKGGFTGFLPPGVEPSKPKSTESKAGAGGQDLDERNRVEFTGGLRTAASAESTEKPEEQKEGLRPPGERKPPYYCKKHPTVKATRSCTHCTEEYCNACAKMIEGSPRCPECGGQINALQPEDQGLPPRSIGANLSDALLFPFKGSGKLMLILGGIFYFLCMVLGDWRVKGFGLAFLYAYGMKVCRSSASGRETPPEWPAFHDLGGALSFFFAWLASRVPAILFVIVACAVFVRGSALQFLTSGNYSDGADTSAHSSDGDEGAGMPELDDKPRLGFEDDESAKSKELRKEKIRKMMEDMASRAAEAKQRFMMLVVLPYYVLSILGDIYLPMAVLAVILYRSYSVLNPLFVFGSIARVGGAYIAAVLAMAVGDIVNMLPKVVKSILLASLGENDGTAWILNTFVIPFVVAFCFLYVLMVYMRALGVMYYYNQRKLQWFT